MSIQMSFWLLTLQEPRQIYYLPLPQNFVYLDHYISVNDSEVETNHLC